MERGDLLSINGKAFTGQGKAIAANAAADARARPPTLTLIAMNNAEGVPRDRFFAMTMLDEIAQNAARTESRR